MNTAPSAPDPRLASYLGSWRGTSRLHMEPGSPGVTTDSTLVATPIAKGRFVQISYTWSHEGVPHEGTMILGMHAKRDEATGAWVDSWHQANDTLFLKGKHEKVKGAASGRVSISGTFPAPPGPDWGWRIAVESPAADRLLLTMYVIEPEGEENLAVHAEYTEQT